MGEYGGSDKWGQGHGPRRSINCPFLFLFLGVCVRCKRFA